ncbi:MAG: hypothetical protein R3B13_33995 [Polyangiaceae bacterium]
MTLLRITVALAALSFSGAAYAEGEAKPFEVTVPEQVPPALALPATRVANADATADAAPQQRKAPAVRRGCASASCSYRSLLGHLVITRDLALPGTETVAVRLLPTSSALAGDSRSPIVLRPRLEDSGYGFNLAARF